MIKKIVANMIMTVTRIMITIIITKNIKIITTRLTKMMIIMIQNCNSYNDDNDKTIYMILEDQCF